MASLLVVEDDAEINNLLALTLSMEGYEVHQARSGPQALEQARRYLPQLVLLDVEMPGMSGHEVARTLHEDARTAHIPIIFVTARQEMEDLVEGLELGVDYVSKPFAMPELLARVRAALRTVSLQEQLRQSNEKLSRLALTDPLTGLCNRRGFETHLEDELWRARRFDQALAVAIFDLDHFKRVNDTWGHTQGDIVLQRFAEVLSHSSRRIDTVARLGGEEFVVVLPATDADGAMIFGEKVRQATEAQRIEVAADVTPQGENTGTTLGITVSGGVAVVNGIPHDEDEMAKLSEQLLHEADLCLYQAKQQGRNQVRVRTLDEAEVIKWHQNAELRASRRK